MKKLIFPLILLVLYACNEIHYPKPYGYFRVDLPPHQYRSCEADLPYTFSYPVVAKIQVKPDSKEKYWIDVDYPSLHAAVHCSYKAVNGDIYALSEDAHRLVYKHLVKADNIIETVFENPAHRVYGVFYELRGNTASAAQFVLTDSVRHFVRGALYFNHVPNKDSIAPMAAYIREDMRVMMESFRWK